jgi:hypothetical protein
MTETSTDEKKTPGISQQLAEQLARHIVPIFMKDGRGKFRSWGSAFLVSRGNVSFLVSAAHVFDPLTRKNDLCIYVGTNKLHHLSGSVFLTPMVDNNRDEDLLDIGVFRLLPVASPPYPEVGKEAIAIDALLSLSLPRGQKHYALDRY